MIDFEARLPTNYEFTKRPFVLGLFGFVLTAQSVLSVILFFVFAVAPSDSVGNFMGEERPIGEVRFEVLAMLVIFSVAAWFTGRGLWKGNPIIRNMVFGLLIVLLILTTIESGAYEQVPADLVAIALIGWYLYLKPNVSDFFSDYRLKQKTKEQA